MAKIWVAINLAQDHNWPIPLTSLLTQGLTLPYYFSPVACDRSSGETWEVTQKKDNSSSHMQLLVGTPLSVVLLYLLSMPCFYIPSLYPFFTQSLPVTHTRLTLPVYVHTLHSLSILLIYPPLYHPTLQPPDSPYFKIPSLHSHSLLPLHTPLISSSLPSASTPFSTISTAQSPLGSPLVTRQPPLYD